MEVIDTNNRGRRGCNRLSAKNLWIRLRDSMCLFLCQYHVVFMTVAPEYTLSVLCFHMNFKVSFPVSVKNYIRILIVIVWNLYGGMDMGKGNT